MCGVHPEAEQIVKQIFQFLLDKKDWQQIIKENKEFDFFLEEYKPNYLQIDIAQIENIVKSLASKMKHWKLVRGFFVFPKAHEARTTTELAYYHLIGSLVGDIIVKQTNKCITTWFYPKMTESEEEIKPLGNWPVFEIGLIMKKAQ